MNRIFSRVWNASLGAWVVASELAVRTRPGSGRSKCARSRLVALPLLAASMMALNASAQTVVEDETVTVPGSYPSPWITDEILYVGVDGTATLSILPGGAVFSGRGRVGWNPGSSGTVTVDGGHWQNYGAITLGNHGTGTLDISNGGQVRSDGNIYLGWEASGNGHINISGPDSLLESGFQWQPGNNVPMFVGMEGRGAINATDGARINSAGGVLGSASGGHGEVLLDNSHWSSTHAIAIGRSGTGTLRIANGSLVTSSEGYVGQYAGSSGEVEVSGPGSILDTGQIMWLGYEGQGKLSVLDGGQVQAVSMSIGSRPTGIGEVHVSGPGSALYGFGVLVGPQGSGALKVTDGGLVYVDRVIVAYSASTSSGNGNVSVSGTGSLLQAADSFSIGGTGTGTLTVSEGAAAEAPAVYIGRYDGSTGLLRITGGSFLTSVQGYIGERAGSSGEVELTGQGSHWNTTELHVGTAGTGSLLVDEGGELYSYASYLGSDVTGQGSVTVSGPGSSWTNPLAYIGHNGHGHLDILDGGSVASQLVFVGYHEDSAGNIRVSGDGSRWVINGDMFFGLRGEAWLDIADGGAASIANTSFIGGPDGDEGHITVSGADSSLTAAQFQIAAGSVSIVDGASLDTHGSLSSSIGHMRGASGTLLVDGAGSRWFNANTYLTVGSGGGYGKLDVLNGGMLETTGSVAVGGSSAVGAFDGISNWGGIPSGTGVATASGAGSTLSGGALNVGTAGHGTVNILDGGLVETRGTGYAGSFARDYDPETTTFSDDLVIGQGLLRISDPGSRWWNDGDYILGYGGNGELVVENGGTARVASLQVGVTRILPYVLWDDATQTGIVEEFTRTGAGKVSVSGRGSTLTVDGTFTVGGEGDAGLLVSDDGVVRAGALQLAEISGNSSVAVRDGGVLEVGGEDGIRTGSGHYDFELSSATLRVVGSDLSTDVDAVLGSTSTIDTNSLNATWNGTLGGKGGLAKSGPGILLLTNGGNSYEGGTRIERGGIEVHATGALGTGAVEIDEGLLVFDSSASAGDAAISNYGGSLIVRNDASLGSARILNSIGQWTDADGNAQQRYGFIQFQSETDPATGLPVENGRLARGGDAHVINEKGASISFANSGYLADSITIENRDDSSVSFNVSGDASGARVQNGPDATVHIIGFHNFGAGGLGRVPGTLELGSLDGGGKVMLGSNTLVLGGLGLDDHISGVISDSGEYLFNGFPTTANPEAAHGGHLVKTGPGTLTLTGENTYSGGTTVSAGTLLGNSLSLQGLIDIHGRLVFDQPFDGTFTDALTGDGSLDKAGASSLVFNGDGSGFHGTTTVQAGTLLVGGDPSFSHVAIGGTVHVEAGATLGGHGTIGGLDAGGTISPGSSLGVLTVQGDAYLRSGSTYLAETDTLGNSDRLHVGGTLTIDPGSTLQIVGSEGRWQPFTDYTLIHAGNGVTGRFDDVYVNFAFLDAILDYSGAGVGLTLQRNTLDFASIALSSNQRGTAAAVEGLGWGDPLYDAVLVLDEGTAVGALDQLAGGIHAASRGALRERSHDLRDAAWARGGRDAGFWAQAIGGWGAIAADGNATRVKQERIGVLLGVDRPAAEDGYIGALIGYDDGELSQEATASFSEVRTLHAGAYGGFRRGRFFMDAGAGYSRHRLDTRRDIAFDLFTDHLEGRYDASTVQAFARGGMALTGVVDGFLDVAHVRVDVDDLREAGGPAALQVEGDDDGTTYASIGMRLDLPVAQGNTRITGSMAWRHRLGGDDPAAVVARFDGSGPFVVEAPATGRNSLVAQASASWRIGANGRFSLAYAGIGGDARDQRVRAAYSMVF